MITVTVDGKPTNSKAVRFSDGATSLFLDMPTIREAKEHVSVAIDPSTPVDSCLAIVIQWNCLVYKDPDVEYTLSVPYYPYGRADRPFGSGSVNMARLFYNEATTGFDFICTVDVHSELEETPRLVSRPGSYRLVTTPETDIICYPDEGAQIRYDSGDKPTVVGYKVRDVNTGWIIGYHLEGKVKGKTVTIVDDICDGGMTFIKCAEALRNAGATKVYLDVTHGIFSKGLQPFQGLIDGISVYHIVGNFVTIQDLINFQGQSHECTSAN